MKHVYTFYNSYISKLLLLAGLYIITGKLGLLLAVPPGYATVIWPPSGIALGVLVIYGWRLWPGILLGSFMLNCYVSDVYSPDIGFATDKIISAFGIATGSTLEAVAGTILIRKFLGIPINLYSTKDILKLIIICCPFSCFISATIGISTLYFSGILPASSISTNWLTWWVGDMFGVLVFFPLVLFSPWHNNHIAWNGRNLGLLPAYSLLAILLPIGLTFYSWKISSEVSYEKTKVQFDILTIENEKALTSRLNSYTNALLGGEGFFHGSGFVSRSEWHNYVATLNISENFPGIKGLGLILPVEKPNLESYVNKMRNSGVPDFTIHPQTKNKPNYIITYIEPQEKNMPALGLNIAFEQNRLDAANLARDSGKQAITKHITLVQDDTKTPGFLILHPIYSTQDPLNTTDERRKAFRGWIFAPFIAEDFMKNLPQSQENLFNLRIYDGDKESPDLLIYKSDSGTSNTPVFTNKKLIRVMQQTWLIVYESTPTYEQQINNDNSFFILVGGAIFTAFFAIFLIVLGIQKSDTINITKGKKEYLLPLAIFIFLSAGSFILYRLLEQKEIYYINKYIQNESQKIDLLIKSQIKEKLEALERMGNRWELGGRTPEKVWRGDAANYIKNLTGLTAIQWVDSKYHIKMVEPQSGNEKALGLNIIFDKQREQALKGAELKDIPTLTPPIDLIQGYKGMIGYIPLKVNNRFDGFIVGIFSINDFFNSLIPKEINNNYNFKINFEEKEYYSNKVPSKLIGTEWSIEKKINIYDKDWQILLTPKEQFVESQKTFLPVLVLFFGLMISVLSALIARFIISSRITYAILEESNKKINEQINKIEETEIRHQQLIDSVQDYAICRMDLNGNLQYYNRSALRMIGLPEDYNLSDITISDTHPKWAVKLITDEAIPACIKNSTWLGESALLHRDGHEIPVLQTLSLNRDSQGNPAYFTIILRDITERKKYEQELKTNEETFRSALENASIGMALVQPNGRWLKANNALCNMLGYSEEELINNNFQSITHPDDLQQDMVYVQQTLEGKIKNYQMEKRYYHRSGRIIYALLSVSLVRDLEGNPRYFISQIQDITERKEMDHIKSEFISVVSHELRTPLTSIRGALGLVLGTMSKDLPQKVKDLLNIANNNSERLILLINDILDMDKIAAGQMRFDMKKTSLAEITQQAVEANQSYAEKFKVTILLDEIDKDIYINVDHARYIQIFSNLLSNAAKFSHEGKNIHISTQRMENNIRIFVKDNGTGIPEEFRPRIFGKFCQADSSSVRTKGGTGLGLHITKSMVEHMNGIIGFDTETNKGTTFWVEFPIIPERITKQEENNSQKEPENKKIKEDSSIDDLPQILHIEDDIDLSNLLAAALNDKAKLINAPTLKEAKKFLRVIVFQL